MPPEAANTIFARPRGERALKDVERAQNVDLGIERRPGDRDPHVGLRGEMEHDLGLAVRDQIGDRVGTNIDAMEREPAGALGTGVGKIGQRSGGEVVDHVDLATLGEETIREGGADETRPSCHQRPHLSSLAAEPS